jgi:hypothetical protein
MAAMANFGWLVLYTFLILFARPGAVALWRAMTSGRRAPGAGIGAEIGAGIAGMTARLRSPRDIGWGAALVPVTVAWLAVFGAFAQATIGNDGGSNLFNAAFLSTSYLWSLVTVLVVAGYALARPGWRATWPPPG